jgi:hypothetical protein
MLEMLASKYLWYLVAEESDVPEVEDLSQSRWHSKG